ncbi:beta-lactamase family protein [bacterium]|nr:beta-lactamase family protein [bacterium]
MTPFSSKQGPGVSISVLKNGKVVLAKGYGMSNLTYGVPMTENSGMSIASVSKQFTAMAIMLLVNEGKLSLDDDVRKHIPELKDFGTPVTLRNMLNHTTGYREILNFLAMAGWRSTDAMDADEPIYVVQRQASLQNPPGSEYNYNNTTFMLLARVVERVSGESWTDFMTKRIFNPLGMNNTTVKTQQGQVIPGSSQGYAPAKGGGYVYVTDFASAYGASGVNSTAMDMTKWMLNYTNMTVGGKSAIEAITTTGVLTSGDSTGYGLGLGVRKWRGQQLYTHTGGETSHRTFFGYMPDIKSGLFISSNHPAYGNGMWTDIAEAFFGEYLEPEKDETPPAKEESASKPTPEQMKAIAGRYQFIGAPLQIVYSIENGTMYAQATNQPRFEVTPTSDSTFTFVGVAASVTFHYESDGSVSRATHHQGPNSPMEKILDEPISPEKLMEYEGVYYNAELETSYTLKVEEGKLMAHHRWYKPFAISHLDNDNFAGGMWFFGSVVFDRDPSGAVSGFSAGNGRTRGVWFDKK